ncbi:MAG: class A beta-lactamase-related serine hydrolase [Bacillota bacterium]|nr:class A beta-lactamase-related serine hydrolase [Bacillota bacterium]
MSRFRWWLAVAVVLVAGLIWIEGLIERRPAPRPAPRPSRLAPARPQPPRPAPAAPSPDYGPLRERLRAYLATRPARYSVYFKDLTSGASFGIDEYRPVHAASTVKVPIVLYLNTLVAEGKASWDTRLTYRAADHYQTGAGILHMVAADGDTYSLRVLANLAITISDNVATRMLLEYLGRENVAAFMRRLGGTTVYPGGENLSTARDMAIYVEAVLDFAKKNPALGERLLDDLAHSIYHVGLPGELPPSVRVAHKEGDVTGVSDDVGVVFAKRPFIFTVLSDGQADPLAGFKEIARLTRIAYDYQNQLPR